MADIIRFVEDLVQVRGRYLFPKWKQVLKLAKPWRTWSWVLVGQMRDHHGNPVDLLSGRQLGEVSCRTVSREQVAQAGTSVFRCRRRFWVILLVEEQTGFSSPYNEIAQSRPRLVGALDARKLST